MARVDGTGTRLAPVGEGTRDMEPFPLTDLQEGYLVGMSPLIELGGFRPNYYVEMEVVDFDPARAEAALNDLVERHEHLRTVVLPEGGQRVVDRPGPVRLPVVDLVGADADTCDAVLRRTRGRLRDEGVDPTRWPLFEVTAHRIRPRGYRIHLALSLLLLDGRGIRQLIHEWRERYLDPAATLPPVRATYREARLALRAREGTEAHRRHLEYWAGRLDTLPEAPALPLAGPLGRIDPVRFTRRVHRIDQERARRLRAACGRRRILPTTALLHVFAEVLGAWATGPSFCLNVLHQTWSGGSSDWSATVGQFGATLPLEIDLRGDDFWNRASLTQRQLFRDLEHADVTAVRVMRDVAVRRGWTPRAALPYVFTSMLRSGGSAEPEPAGPACRITDSCLRTPQVLIDNQVQDAPGGAVECVWDVVDDAFPPGLPDIMFDAYRRLLDTLAAPGTAVPDPAPAGHRAVVAALNRPAAPPPAGRLEDGFLRHAAADPGAVAVLTSRRTLTYGDLDAASLALAHRLRAHGVGREDVVPVVMAKGWEQVVAVLGVLRAGAAYCPIDAGLPADRIRHLVGTCSVPLALTLSDVPAGLDGTLVVPVDTLAPTTDPLPAPPPDAPSDPSALAYVIHTSGSTGEPKGVQIEHRAALNTVMDVNARIGLGPGDRVFGISSLSFDLSVWDVFGTLAAGAALVLPDASSRPDPVGWAATARRHGVTVWNSVPALAEMLDEVVAERTSPGRAPIRAFLLSGDWIYPALVERLRGGWSGARILAMGGATEASIWSNLYEVERVDHAWRGVPYGRPLSNQTMRVLDERLDVRPPWAVGRIHIGGVGLARGYLGDAARTAERFVRHPRTGERLYWTGDLGRYWPDGTIEFLGREDRQLKIQGFRVEPGEIEVALRGHPAVRECVVTTEDTPGGRRLVAVVTPAEGSEPEPAELLAHIRARLPYYMVPGRLNVVPRLPLTANGKVDVARTSVARRADDATPAEAGADSRLSGRLAELWAGVLEVARVGADDDFFALGGNSLLALRLVNRVRAELGVELPFGQVFEAPTVRAMAGCLRRAERDAARTVVLSERVGTELFLFHPVGGSVVAYVPLARAWAGPVRAFQSRGLVGDRSATEPPPGLPAMAAAYREELRRLAPTGPYVLGGWSMGGVIAYEVARQLAEHGEQAYPFMIDSAAWQPRAPATDLDRHREFLIDLAAGRLPAAVAAGLSAAAPADLAHVARDLAVGHRLLPSEVDAAQYAHLLGVHADNLAALSRYRPGRFDGPALLFVAADVDRPDPVPSWRAVCPGLTTRVWPCDHYSIVTARRLAAVADDVRAWLAGIGGQARQLTEAT